MSERPYVDRNGKRYTSAVERWHSVARKALGIRLAEDVKPTDTKTAKKEIK